MESYRSGHNEPDSKSGRPQGLVGSNPTLSAKKASSHAGLRVLRTGSFLRQIRRCPVFWTAFSPETGFSLLIGVQKMAIRTLRAQVHYVRSVTGNGDAAIFLADGSQCSFQTVHHGVCGRELGIVVEVGVDVCRRRKVAVTEPFLNLLHRDTIGQEQRGAAMPEVMIIGVCIRFLFRTLPSVPFTTYISRGKHEKPHEGIEPQIVRPSFHWNCHKAVFHTWTSDGQTERRSCASPVAFL